MAADGNIAAVSETGGEGTGASISLFDISDPTMPSEFSTIPESVFAVAMSGAQLYFNTSRTLEVWDVAAGMGPEPLGTYFSPLLESPFDAAVDGDVSSGIVATAGGGRLFVIDTRAPQPWMAGQVDLENGAEALDIKVYGNEIYVVLERAIVKYDVTDPMNPRAVGATDGSTGGPFTYVQWRPTGIDLVQTRWGNFVMASDFFFINQSPLFDADLTANQGLVDFTNAYEQQFPMLNPQNVRADRLCPAAPCVVYKWDAEGWDIAVGDRFAAIHSGQNGVQVVELTPRTSLF